MVKQKHNEPVHYYIRRSRDIRNRCFSVNIAEKDLADIAFSGLLAHIKDKLEGQEFLDVSQLLQKALVQENQVKEIKQSTQFNHSKEKVGPTVNTLECDNDSASDDDVEICRPSGFTRQSLNYLHVLL